MGAGGQLQHLAAIDIVDDDAEGRVLAGGLLGGAIDQLLEFGDAGRRLAMALGEAGELGAVIEGQRADLRPVAAPVRRPMDMLEPGIEAQRPLRRCRDRGNA